MARKCRRTYARYCVPPRPRGIDCGTGVPLARALALSISSIVSRAALGVGVVVPGLSDVRSPQGIAQPLLRLN